MTEPLEEIEINFDTNFLKSNSKNIFNSGKKEVPTENTLYLTQQIALAQKQIEERNSAPQRRLIIRKIVLDNFKSY